MEDNLRYPIGRYDWKRQVGLADISEAIDAIELLPQSMDFALDGLDEAQLDTPYRPGGWTVRQLVHHVADSHMHAYVRLKFALTESAPVIKPYSETAWAELADSRCEPASLSMSLIEALHRRWVGLLRSLTAPDFEKTFQHPELGPVSLDRHTSLYAWHGRHHAAHITTLRQRMNWQ
jgi:hypothetical protein